MNMNIDIDINNNYYYVIWQHSKYTNKYTAGTPIVCPVPV